MTESPDRLDRLSSLISRFQIHAAPTDAARSLAESEAVLIVLGEGGEARAVRLGAAAPAPEEAATVLAAAIVDFGGPESPVARGLPRQITLDAADHAGVAAAAGLLVMEAQDRRCGGAAAFQRIAEVLIIQILRAAIERGVAHGGLLAGLADPKLARALTAIHDAPGHPWSADALADHAGMSRSRFIDRFNAALGEPPMRYLAGFRMLLARRELENGARVGSVARRYGYSAPDAFARAYRRRFGAPPRTARKPVDGRPEA